MKGLDCRQHPDNLLWSDAVVIDAECSLASSGWTTEATCYLYIPSALTMPFQMCKLIIPEELMHTIRDATLIKLTYCFVFVWCICLHGELCSWTMVSGNHSEPMQWFSWQNQACFLMQCHHLGPKPHLLRTEIFPDLCASFEDNMYSMMIYEVSKFLHRETLFWNCSTIFRCCFRCWSLLNLSKMFFLCPIMWLTCLHLAEIVAKCSSSCFLKHYYTFPAFCFLISPMLQPSN